MILFNKPAAFTIAGGSIPNKSWEVCSMKSPWESPTVFSYHFSLVFQRLLPVSENTYRMTAGSRVCKDDFSSSFQTFQNLLHLRRLHLYWLLLPCMHSALRSVKSEMISLLSRYPPTSGCMLKEVAMTESLRSTGITPASSLLRILPHLPCTSLLSYSHIC